MFMYLRTTGGAAARGLRFLARYMTCRRCLIGGGGNGGGGANRKAHRRSSSTSSASSAGNNGSGSNCGSLSRRSLSTLEHQRNTWQTRGGSSGSHSDHQMMQLRPVSGGGSKAPPGVPLSEERPPVAVPIFGCLIMIGIYLLFGAAFVARTTNVDYRDGFYFCFVALCTVGLGGSTVIRHASDGAIVLVVVYVFIGVTLLSTVLHILHYDVYVNLKTYRDLKLHHRRSSAASLASKRTLVTASNVSATASSKTKISEIS